MHLSLGLCIVVFHFRFMHLAENICSWVLRRNVFWHAHRLQLTSFLTYRFTMNFLITVLSFAMPSLISIVLYYSFYTNPNAVSRTLYFTLWHYLSLSIQMLSEVSRPQVRQIWKDIRHAWNILKNEAEREIMRKYSLSGQLYSTAILCMKMIYKKNRARS